MLMGGRGHSWASEAPSHPSPAVSNRTAENAGYLYQRGMGKRGETHMALWPYLGMIEGSWGCQEDRVQVAHLSPVSFSSGSRTAALSPSCS